MIAPTDLIKPGMIFYADLKIAILDNDVSLKGGVSPEVLLRIC